MSYETDEAEATELVLFADNDYRTYKRREAFDVNLAKKLAAGTYDHAQAPKLWRYYVDYVVQEYDRQHGSGRGSLTIVSPRVRQLAAQMFADRFHLEVKAGEHDDLIASVMTKKRRKELGLA